MLSKDQGGEGWQSFLVHNHEPFQALLSPKQQIIAAICVSIIIVILIWCRMLDFLSERVFFEVDSAQDEQWRRLQRPPWAFGVGDIAIRGILANRDADYFRVKSVRNLLIADPETIRLDMPASTLKLLGKNSITQIHGKQHKKERKILQQAFTPQNLRGYTSRLTSLTESMLKDWHQRGKISGCREIRRYVMSVATSILAGFENPYISPDGFEKVNELYLQLWDGLIAVPINLPGFAYHKGCKAARLLEKLIYDRLDEYLDTYDDHAQKQPDPKPNLETNSVDDSRKVVKSEESVKLKQNCGRTIVEVLATVIDEDGSPIKRDHIARGCIALLIGAVDTTAAMMQSALWYVACNPAVMASLQEEQKNIIAKFGSGWTEDVVAACKYAEAVVKETLRLQSPAGVVFRKALKDINLDGEYLIRKGERILISLKSSILADERWANDSPLTFNPERWLTSKGTRSGAWVPFGGGFRQCLGQQLALMEGKVFLAVLARSNLQIKLAEPGEKWSGFPLLTPVHGMPLLVDLPDDSGYNHDRQR